VRQRVFTPYSLFPVSVAVSFFSFLLYRKTFPFLWCTYFSHGRFRVPFPFFPVPAMCFPRLCCEDPPPAPMEFFLSNVSLPRTSPPETPGEFSPFFAKNLFGLPGCGVRTFFLPGFPMPGFFECQNRFPNFGKPEGV